MLFLGLDTYSPGVIQESLPSVGFRGILGELLGAFFTEACMSLPAHLCLWHLDTVLTIPLCTLPPSFRPKCQAIFLSFSPLPPRHPLTYLRCSTICVITRFPRRLFLQIPGKVSTSQSMQRGVTYISARVLKLGSKGASQNPTLTSGQMSAEGAGPAWSPCNHTRAECFGTQHRALGTTAAASWSTPRGF